MLKQTSTCTSEWVNWFHTKKSVPEKGIMYTEPGKDFRHDST